MEGSSRLASLWGLCFLLIIASTVVAYKKVGTLPILDFELGNELRVRSTEYSDTEKVLQKGKGTKMMVGDKLVSLAGHRVKSLPDLSAILGGTRNVGELTIQFVRPVHRFTVDVRTAKGGDLPGVIPSDLLREVDGRPFSKPIALEGVGSIIAHRPQAVLGFERNNALFQATIFARKPIHRLIFLIVFLLSFSLAVVLFFAKQERIHPVFGIATSFGGLSVAWAFFFAMEYQWVLAESVSAICVTIGLVLSRPFAMFAWGAVRDNEKRPWSGLFIALIVGGAFGTIGYLGILEWEKVLQFSGIIAAGYIVYESFLIFIAPSRSTFGERGIYLVGVVSIVLVAAFAQYISNEALFLEKSWPWFVATMLLLVWLQDFVFSIRGPETTGIAAISQETDRDLRIAEYLREMGTKIDDARLKLCVLMDEETSVFELNKKGRIVLQTASSELHDALCILTEEQVEIPQVSGTNNQLMEGIAKSMNFMAAAEIAPPISSLTVDGTRVVFLAFQTKKQTPSYASTETLDAARWAMSPVVWSALIVSALKQRGGKKDGLLSESRTKIKRLEAKNQKLLAEMESSSERSDSLQKDQQEMGTLVQYFAKQNQQEFYQSLDNIEELLEPGLIDSVKYLLESKLPIVIAGARGTGKTFVGIFAHYSDESFPGPLSIIDASNHVNSGGQTEALPEIALEAIQGGAMIIRNAILLTDRLLEELLDSSSERFRLILCYTDANAMIDTVLTKIPEEIRVRLEDRELVMPNFEDRTSIKRAVLQHLLEIASLPQRRDVLGFSRDAWVALESNAFPGNIAEAKHLIAEGLAISKGEVLETSDLF